MNPLRRALTGSGRLPDDLRAALTAWIGVLNGA
jgi:hypothetical protein